ncbi:hypothetical protein M8523_30180, partial [Hyphomicrobiales bacterium BP6-180914]|nr:hypothetical protein [Lichenifustis flavocetrariae]
MTPFQQIAPDLVRDGLVKNKEWVPIAGDRAAQCFSDPELQRAAAFLAALHPFAIDYIEQAPALVLAALGARRLVTRQGRMHLAQSFIVVCEPGPRLGKLMRLYGLAPELRALNGHVL